METTIVLQGFFGVYGDHGKENANYYNGLVIILGLHYRGSILGLYRDNAKEHGDYYSVCLDRQCIRKAAMALSQCFRTLGAEHALPVVFSSSACPAQVVHK